MDRVVAQVINYLESEAKLSEDSHRATNLYMLRDYIESKQNSLVDRQLFNKLIDANSSILTDADIVVLLGIIEQFPDREEFESLEDAVIALNKLIQALGYTADEFNKLCHDAFDKDMNKTLDYLRNHDVPNHYYSYLAKEYDSTRDPEAYETTEKMLQLILGDDYRLLIKPEDKDE